VTKQVCRRCSECSGVEHHFLEHCEDPTEVIGNREPFVGFICKHCEVTTPACDDCLLPIWPLNRDATICSVCEEARGAEFWE